jgi:hypothetical protein
MEVAEASQESKSEGVISISTDEPTDMVNEVSGLPSRANCGQVSQGANDYWLSQLEHHMFD